MATATKPIAGDDLAERITAAVPDAVVEVAGNSVLIKPEKLIEVAQFLHDDRNTDARFLNALSGVDRYDYFEVVYHLSSLAHNHSLVLKVRADHDNPEVPSVFSVWQGANLQEREADDRLGIQ